jgi:hypothetical protein
MRGHDPLAFAYNRRLSSPFAIEGMYEKSPYRSVLNGLDAILFIDALTEQML